MFQSGNAQAVRLPREMRLDASEVEVTRHSEVLILRPLRPNVTFAGAFDALARMGDDVLPDGRQHGEAQEREAF